MCTAVVYIEVSCDRMMKTMGKRKMTWHSRALECQPLIAGHIWLVEKYNSIQMVYFWYIWCIFFGNSHLDIGVNYQKYTRCEYTKNIPSGKIW